MLAPDTNNELNTQIQYRLIEKLTASERRYRERVENLREIVFECDLLGRLTFVNRAWKETLGYPIEESIGQFLTTFIDPLDIECWQFILQKQANQPNQPANYPTTDLLAEQHEDPNCFSELRFHHQTGIILWLELSIQPHQSELNPSENLFGSLINVTERKHAEAVLQQANEQLELRVQQRTAELRQANQSLTTTLQTLRSTQTQLIQTEKMSGLGQLVAGVAHEINNPVSFVRGNIQPAREYAEELLNLLALYQQYYPVPEPPIAEILNEGEIEFIQTDFPRLLNSMEIGAKRIQEIVSSLRNFSRLDESGFKIADIHEGLENTLLILNHRLKAEPPYEHIKLIRHYSDLPPVLCCPGQLNQVFMNLLSNAIDALRSNDLSNNELNIRSDGLGNDDWNNIDMRHPHPTIMLKTKVMNDQVAITIADNGMGIPTNIMPKLFEPFFTTKPIGKGTGLGLSISHQIITEKHRGSLKCDSTVGEGTAFIIQIPISP